MAVGKKRPPLVETLAVWISTRQRAEVCLLQKQRSRRRCQSGVVVRTPQKRGLCGCPLPDGFGMLVGMTLKTDKTLCSTKEAAEILGCTVSRIRQMARAGELWSQNISQRAAVLDLAEIKAKALKPVTRGRPRRNAIGDTR